MRRAARSTRSDLPAEELEHALQAVVDAAEERLHVLDLNARPRANAQLVGSHASVGADVHDAVGTQVRGQVGFSTKGRAARLASAQS